MLINKLLRHNIHYLIFIILLTSSNNVYANDIIPSGYQIKEPTANTNQINNEDTLTILHTTSPQTSESTQLNATNNIHPQANTTTEETPTNTLNEQTKAPGINKNQNIINSKQINPTSILSKDERREYIRLNSWELAKPIQISINNDNRNKLINISRGGLAFKHSNSIKAGSIIPITIKYRTLNIKTYAQIISSNSYRANGKFINPNKLTENQLLYLSVLLEADNNILITKFN